MTRPDSRALAAAAAALVALLNAAAAGGAKAPEATTVRITSPLGRTGLDGPIRIVAQVQRPQDVRLGPVRFFVDGQLLGSTEAGPPFAIEWTDQNPYEAREIGAEVCIEGGECVRDTVKLPPLEVNEEAQVSSVLVEASVQDGKGRYVGDLSLEHFFLREDDAEQKLDLVRSDTVPSTYTLLIDCSQSMSRRMDFVHLAAARLLRFLRPEDKVIVVPFTKNVGTITGPTGDLQTVTSAIEVTKSAGGTAVLDTVTRLPELLQGVTGRQAVILLTDGYDEHSTHSFEDAMRAAKATQASLFVIGIGGSAGISIKGERALKALAEHAGGRAFFPTRDDELPRIHELIAADIQQRYLLAYTPNNQRIDGAWRTINLTTLDPTHKVRARPGYFAPKPPPVRATIEFVIATDDVENPIELSSGDLELTEDGVRQDIDTFHEAVAPLSIVLAVDASGSMKSATEAVKEAAKSVVASLRPKDELSLLLFADDVVTVHDLSTNREGIVKGIDEYQASGGTALNDAVVAALGRLGRVDRRRAIVLMTDGRDENNPGTAPGSRHSLADVLEQIREVDAAIYSIGLGPKVDRQSLTRLAAASGGEAFFPIAVDELASNYQRVVERLRRRYVASYVSSNPRRGGEWRRVEIVSHIPGVAITSRGGYFAPKD
jgi:VWFA-related protein